jgi:opacity protein-like surface antigen
MKLKTLLAVATAVGGVCAAPAYAQETPAPAPAPPKPEAPHASGFYAGGGINLYFLDRDYAADGMPIAFEDQPSPGAFMGRLGYAFNENVAIEVEAGIGGARSEFTTSGGNPDGEIGIETPLGAHVVLSVPINRNTYLLGKAGYVSATISREYLGVDYEDLDISGAAFGVGAGFRSGPWDFRMEYAFMSGGDSGDGGVLGMFALHHF